MSPPRRPSPSRVGAVLLDVEGTTTSIRFVHDTLFPMARRQMPHYLAAEAREGDPAGEIASLRVERDAEPRTGTSAEYPPDQRPPEWTAMDPVGSAVEYATWLMDRDRKSTALKRIQGRIWERAYRHGEIQGHLFDDVLPAFLRWTARGVEVYIFSSGSVLAQKLLFGHSVAGDLDPFISGYFDTTTGSKKDAASYRAIAQHTDLDPARFLFVSDSVGELDAACKAGMTAVASVRPGNATLPDGMEHVTVVAFDEIDRLFS